MPTQAQWNKSQGNLKGTPRALGGLPSRVMEFDLFCTANGVISHSGEITFLPQGNPEPLNGETVHSSEATLLTVSTRITQLPLLCGW